MIDLTEIHVCVSGATRDVATSLVTTSSAWQALSTAAGLVLLLADGSSVSLSYPNDCGNCAAWWRLDVTPETRALVATWIRAQQRNASARLTAQRIARAA
jgi:hypothetical protein